MYVIVAIVVGILSGILLAIQAVVAKTDECVANEVSRLVHNLYMAPGSTSFEQAVVAARTYYNAEKANPRFKGTKAYDAMDKLYRVMCLSEDELARLH